MRMYSEAEATMRQYEGQMRAQQKVLLDFMHTIESLEWDAQYVDDLA